MTPIQQLFLGTGSAVAKKTYVDDLFSTFLYDGNSSTQSISNSVDLTEGGMVWIKNRTSSYDHQIYDTVRGIRKRLKSNNNAAEDTETHGLTSFTGTGFTLGSNANANNTGQDFSSWTFRKEPGFFDVVTYTGNGVDGRSISHSLGCIPGMWMVKRTDGTGSWVVGHSRILGGTGDDYKWHLYLNESDDKDVNGEFTYNSPPTATTLSLGSSSAVNGDGNDYVAYVFAGGESTAATARSVDFDGVGDYLSFAASSDFQLGTGDFTVEGWFKYDGLGNTPCIFDFRSTTGSVTDGFAAFVKSSTGKLGLYTAGGWICDDGVAQFENQWYHFAAVKSSGTIKLYINGTQSGSSYTTSTDFTNNTLKIGSGATGANQMQGWISNLRVVKGTAVYTSSFRPPTEPLTNITNTKLLCCNNSSTTGSTVTPGTITANGDPTASTDSPFDDPAAHIFGKSGSESVIKCGSYTGNGSSTGPEINLGFEPQWVLIKGTETAGNWTLLDSMRGIVTGGNDMMLKANSEDEETTTNDYIELTPTGFKIKVSVNQVNKDGDNYIYMCLRRPDGYVGKPPELGTGVFAMDTGNSSSDGPAFDSNFAVDFALLQQPASSGLDWRSFARLTGTKSLATNTNASETTESSNTSDYNDGFADSYTNVWQSWMLKRHAGFDVVTYTGDDVDGRWIPHSMNAAAEMVWIKRRSHTGQWIVGHKGLDGGTAPWTHYLTLETTDAEADYPLFHDTAPTSTHFKVGGHGEVNGDDKTFIAMLFASVDGISKVGYFDGQDSTITITTGFQPRFLIIKRITGADGWLVFDTTRGWGSGNDYRLLLNSSTAQSAPVDYGAPTSTGFTMTTRDATNASGEKYIYYAHA